MTRRILIFNLALLLGIGASCEKKEDKYLISANSVGLLTPKVPIHDLDSVFAEDSIVRQVNDSELYRNSNEIEIYDENAKKLLLLEPVQAFDSTSTVGFIQVLDPRYKTAKGLHLKSTFKDIVENYKISRIENTLSAAVVFIDELNIYISIDKKELPAELRYDTETPIRASQIPDEAKFKYFMIGWN